MSIDVYYFSGSGNSLFIAKELQKRVPDCNLISITSLINEEKIVSKAEVVGFVFPVHCTTFPVPVKNFISKLNLSSSKYLFAISTQGGAPPRLVEFHLKKVFNEKNKKLDAFFSVKMPWSSPVGLMPVYIPGLIEYPKSQKKIAKLESAALKKLDLISDIVQKQKHNSNDDFPRSINLFLKRFMCKLMLSATDELEKNKIDFYANSDCTGCGICEDVCLSSKIKMIDDKPEWQEGIQCYFCYACFNFCPVQSIMIKKIYSKKGGRYFHPKITAKEIAMQKNVSNLSRNSSIE